MRALILLSGRSDDEISNIGNVYVRLLLPCVTQKLLKDAELLLIDNGRYESVEEGLKIYLMLLAVYLDEQAKYRITNLMTALFLQVAEIVKVSNNPKCQQILEIISGAFLQIASKSPIFFKSVMQELGENKRQGLEEGLKVFVKYKTIDHSFASFPGRVSDDTPKIHLKKFGE
jgi:hypothetical protein